MRTRQVQLVLCLVASLHIATAAASSSEELADHPPREINRDPEAIVTMGSLGTGPGAAKWLLYFAVEQAESIVHGHVVKRALVHALADSVARDDVLVLVSVDSMWKAPEPDSLWVRLWPLQHRDTGSDSVGWHSGFTPGAECLLFLLTDDSGELVAAPGVVLPDTVFFWTDDMSQPLAPEVVVSVVDSCAALWSLPAMARQADLIIEGGVRFYEENWPSIRLELVDTVVYKGTPVSDTLRLARNPRWHYDRQPSFRPGERVVLLARSWGQGLTDLVGGWQGAWVVAPDGGLEVMPKPFNGSMGGTTRGAQPRPSQGLPHRVTRSEFLGALEESSRTLPN
jgi:hypothetical protein